MQKWILTKTKQLLNLDSFESIVYEQTEDKVFAYPKGNREERYLIYTSDKPELLLYGLTGWICSNDPLFEVAVWETETQHRRWKLKKEREEKEAKERADEHAGD